MLLSYLDCMTGFYLCFTYIILLLALRLPNASKQLIFSADILSLYDDESNFNGCHFGASLDSVNTMNSVVNQTFPISSIISSVRSHDKLTNFHNRDSVLQSVPQSITALMMDFMDG